MRVLENESTEETDMNVSAIHNSYGFTAKAVAALLAFAIGAAPGALAAADSKSSVPVPGAIISHLGLAGGPATRMRLAKRNGKRLLFIEDGSAQVVRVVDVTMPEQPHSIEQSGGTQHVPRLSAAGLAANSPDILALLHSIGAKNPQQAHNFAGPARFLADARHGLIFVVDGDGLWIVKARQSVGEYAAPYDNSAYGTIYGG
jgi:hypothetical protein